MEPATIMLGLELADIVVGALAGTTVVSEVLPHVKKVKANSTFQLLWNIGKAIFTAGDSGKEPPAKAKAKA